MKVLFICSGNSKFGISPIIKSQCESLRKCGMSVDYFTITGRGLLKYFRNIFKLKKEIKSKKYDILHAHYVLCGWVSLMATPGTPIVVSYMGSDTYGVYRKDGRKKLSSIYLIILAMLLQPFIKSIIVKSKNLYNCIYLKKKTHVIPNGVDLTTFQPKIKEKAQKEVMLDKNKMNILFLGSKNSNRKNIGLLHEAVKNLNNKEIEIINPYPCKYGQIPIFISACDVLVLTSLNEGSPNVIKEAMACNCPIVSTDVGDVKEIIGDTDGCYITSFDAEDVADKIKKALHFSKTNGRTKGRHRLIELGLDSESIAKRIISVYKEVLNKHEN